MVGKRNTPEILLLFVLLQMTTQLIESAPIIDQVKADTTHMKEEHQTITRIKRQSPIDRTPSPSSEVSSLRHKKNSVRQRRHVRQSDQEMDISSSVALTITGTPTFNFELDYVDSGIYLSYKNRRIIDLLNPEKQSVHDSLSLLLEVKVLTIINASGHMQNEYDCVKNLTIFNRTHVFDFDGSSGQIDITEGVLFVNKGRAFFSSSRQLNILLNNQLSSIISRPPDVTLTFQDLPGGGLMLLVSGEPVIMLDNAQVTPVPTNKFIQYDNNTVLIQDVNRHEVDKSYTHVIQFYVLDGIRPGLEKHVAVASIVIAGGGILYVHEESGRAFYSRNRQINIAITEHVNNLSELPNNIVFSIQFEINRDRGLIDESLFVVIFANGDEIIRLDPSDTEDQSLTLQHSLFYNNRSLFILDDVYVAGAFIEVDKLIVFDGFALKIYEGSAVLPFAGSGQIFNSGFLGFYSTNTYLSDQIGEALLAAVGVSSPADSTSPKPTTPTVYSSPTSFLTVTTEYEVTGEPHPTHGKEKSQKTHTRTRRPDTPADISPRPAKPVPKTRPTGPSSHSSRDQDPGFNTEEKSVTHEHGKLPHKSSN